MSSGEKPVDANFDSFARKSLLVPVTDGHVAAVDDDRKQIGLRRIESRFDFDGRRTSSVVGKLFGPFGLSLNRRPTNDEKLFVFDRQLDLLLFCLLLPHY